MEISLDQLMMIVGQKETELFLLRHELAQMQAKVKELEDKIDGKGKEC